MKKIIIPIAVAALATAFYSCKKNPTSSLATFSDKVELGDITGRYLSGVPDNAIRFLPESDEEKHRVAMIDKITDIFKALYEDDNNIKLVNAAVKCGLYSDETILLKDLIDGNSLLKSYPGFNALTEGTSLNLDDFSTQFWDIAHNLGEPEFIEFLNEIVTQTNTINSQISVYFPYSVDYAVTNADVTLVAGVADTDEILGFQKGVQSDNGGGIYGTMITVNDDYAATTKPVHIIGVNGTVLRANTVSPLADFWPGGDILTPGLSREVKQVYTGDVRCKRQYDALVSFTGNGGGSEIRFVKGDGYLATDGGHVNASGMVQPNDISRKDIRQQNWINWTREFDPDWEADNFQMFVGIYEEDNRNDGSVAVSLSTTTKSDNGQKKTGEVGIKWNYKTDDAVIFQDILNRDVFFVLNRSSTFSICGNHEGWPKRNCNADVEFTLADRTLAP
ncbi:MAG: hypothetical protein BGO31_12965 [Bacteroidetes bacterium 43-16]|nr:MAG: hypothetical protein BGO31_12965 [Bacteroidetes bacterium 43-16]